VPKEIKDMTLEELLDAFGSEKIKEAVYLYLKYEQKERARLLRQEILARFAALEKKNADSEQTTTSQCGVPCKHEDFSYLKDRPS